MHNYTSDEGVQQHRGKFSLGNKFSYIFYNLHKTEPIINYVQKHWISHHHYIEEEKKCFRMDSSHNNPVSQSVSEPTQSCSVEFNGLVSLLNLAWYFNGIWKTQTKAKPNEGSTEIQNEINKWLQPTSACANVDTRETI